MTDVLSPVPGHEPAPVALLPGERTYQVQNGTISLRVREWGDASAPPIVLLHGLRGYSGSWRGLAAGLANEFRLIAFDARGRGESDWDPARNYYTDAYLSDLEAVVDAVVPGRFALIGHSMGGTTSYVYAAKHPERLTALVVEDITAGSSVAGAGYERIVSEMKALPVRFADWAEARAYWRRLRPHVGNDAIEERLFESMRADDKGSIVWRYDADGIAATRISPEVGRVVDLAPIISAIRVPTLVIRGSKSDFCNLDTVTRLEAGNGYLAHATVEGATHYVHDDAPEAFLRLVRSFLVDARRANAQEQGETMTPADLARTGADLMFEALSQGGARICFANPGTTEMSMVSALARSGKIRTVLSLFEGVCTGAADGYARVSGNVPMTLLHLGPGFANGIANLHNARRAGSRIINIIGDHARWHLPYDAPLTSDIESLAAPVSRAVIRMSHPQDVAADVEAAFAATQEMEGGAATVIVPTDVIDAPAAGTAGTRPVEGLQRAKVQDSAIAAAAQHLQSDSEFIVLLGGNALDEAGIRAGAAVAGHLGGRLLMEPYPAIVTLGGDLPAVERQAYFPDDVIAQFGASRVILAGARAPISYFGYEGWPSQLVDEDRLIRLAGPEHDAVDALERLAEAVGATPVEPLPFKAANRSDATVDAALSPANVVDELIVQLPEDAIISLEGSTLGGPWLRNAHKARRHRVMTNTGGAIGQGLPCAVGAALAAPGQRVVSLQSDGSAQYTLQALWTMAREKLPVTVIMAANHRYAILQTELVRAEQPLDDAVTAGLTRLDNPRIDWVALAGGYGVEAVKVATVAELSAALLRGLALDKPFLIQAELP